MGITTSKVHLSDAYKTINSLENEIYILRHEIDEQILENNQLREELESTNIYTRNNMIAMRKQLSVISISSQKNEVTPTEKTNDTN